MYSVLNYILKYQVFLVKILISILKMFPKSILYACIDKYEIEINITHNKMKNIFLYLKYLSIFKYESISDIIGIDNFTNSNRFKIIYNLLSFMYASRLRVSTQTSERLPIWSLTHIYSSAFWQEREIWDLFGIMFTNHSDLRRILTDYGFVGHPLRKDFPLTGFVEVYYNDNYKYVGLKPVSLAQEFRKFEHVNPWN